MNKTWFIDIDGTIFKHRNNQQIDVSQEKGEHEEELLPGVKEFFKSIPENDEIVLVTARHKEHHPTTHQALQEYEIPCDAIIYDLPSGPRILINDIKPSESEDNPDAKEIDTAYAINVTRNEGLRHLVNDDGNC